VRFDWRYLVLLFMLLLPLYPKGTQMGTLISNHADIKYTTGSQELNASSNIDKFVIDRIVDLDISWQDVSPVIVGSGDRDVALSFLLTNLGNGNDIFTLAYEHNSSTSFDPAPIHVRIYLDSDRSGLFDSTRDLLLVDDTNISNDINISADANVTLFLLSDIVDDNESNYTADELSYDGIRAKSVSHPTKLPDSAELVDAVVRVGESVAMGIYKTRDYWFRSTKSVLIVSDDNQTHTGSILHYTVLLKLVGETKDKSVDSVVVSDQIPEGSSYLPDSLHLDGKLLTDIVDGDEGDTNSTHIRVIVGVVAGDDNHTVEFEVMVD